MKKFRIAKCLNNNGIGISEYAIFEDGSERKKIHEHTEYGKYFHVNNELNKNAPSYFRFSFTGRIKDAIETIRNGNGDCLLQSELLGGKFNRVVYFVNREIGDKLRAESIKGWEGTKFAFAVECGNKNSFSGYAPINEKQERISMFDEDRNPKTFDTEDDAGKYIKALLDEAATYARKLVADFAACDGDKIKESVVFDTYRANLKLKYDTNCSVVEDFVYDMLADDMSLKSEDCSLDQWGYKIVQTIVE